MLTHVFAAPARGYVLNAETCGVEVEISATPNERVLALNTRCNRRSEVVRSKEEPICFRATSRTMNCCSVRGRARNAAAAERDSVASREISPLPLCEQLIYAWGNESWSADKHYLAEVIRRAARANGRILECGSGLTTVLAGIVAANCGTRVCHVILDNLSAHQTKKVEEFLTEHPNVHLHFTPTYSSWLNQVELWFGKIERDVITRGIFTSIKGLARKLMHYIRRYNLRYQAVEMEVFKPQTPHYYQFSRYSQLVEVIRVDKIAGSYASPAAFLARPDVYVQSRREPLRIAPHVMAPCSGGPIVAGNLDSVFSDCVSTVVGAFFTLEVGPRYSTQSEFLEPARQGFAASSAARF